MWLKIVVENYCRQLYAKRIELDEETDVTSDRNWTDDISLKENTRNIDMEDLHKILNMMPNQRYRQLIELRYVEDRSNEETADLLGMTMANYYNKHKLAKAQYCEMLRKEGLI
jgi:DNA-directed RNA polymerase specialized sigma24 family protein